MEFKQKRNHLLSEALGETPIWDSKQYFLIFKCIS